CMSRKEKRLPRMQAIEFLLKESGDSVAKTAREHGLVRQSLMGLLRRKTDYTLKVFGELANALGLIDPRLYKEIAAMPCPERSAARRKKRGGDRGRRAK